MMTNRFTIDTGHREPINKLEAHLIEVACAWCAGKSSTPINTTAEFKKKLESEVAWFCLDNPKFSSDDVVIGLYDETVVFIKPPGRDIRATATITLRIPISISITADGGLAITKLVALKETLSN